MNILCLHGCNQTKDMFSSILKPLMEISTTYAKNKKLEVNWHFIEAKYDHPQGGKTWYNKPLDVDQIGSIPLDHDLVDGTLDDLTEVINKLNINVLVGFSQGGNVVDTYLVNRPNNIKCAVIFSGYNLVDPERKIIDTPVMNVCSQADIVVPCKFMPNYSHMEIKEHDKGHKIPTSRPFLREILDFMTK